MARLAALLAFCLAAGPGQADTVIAARTIRAQTILTAGDVTLVAGEIVGTYVSLDEVVGQEARVALYAGRPIRSNDVGPPAVVARNQIVTLFYSAGALRIAAEGRALGRGGVGDRLRVMNLASRQVVSGTVREDGSVSVGPAAIAFPDFPSN